MTVSGVVGLPDVALGVFLFWWLRAFVLTQLVELGVGTLMLLGEEASVLRRTGALFTASLLTHPVLWFIAPFLFESYDTYVVVSEVTITLVESVVLWRLVPTRTFWQALLTSAVMNGSSIVAGIIAEPFFYA